MSKYSYSGRRLDPAAVQQGPRAAIVVVHSGVEVREEDLAATQRAALALVAAGAHHHRVQHPPVDVGVDQPRGGAVEEGPGELNQLSDAAHVPPGGEVQSRTYGVRRLTQGEGGVGHVVDRDDVDGSRAAGRQHPVGPAREGAQRPVDDVEAGGPAAVALAHDDAGAHDRDRHPANASV